MSRCRAHQGLRSLEKLHPRACIMVTHVGCRVQFLGRHKPGGVVPQVLVGKPWAQQTIAVRPCRCFVFCCALVLICHCIYVEVTSWPWISFGY